jgi:steroid 5-alpha reductase family enzyme
LSPSIQTQDLWAYQIYHQQYLTNPTFYVGLFLFLYGFDMNNRADSKLRNLRKTKMKCDDDNGELFSKENYQIPYGGLFAFVSCPNYLGEIIEWFGFTMACGFTKCSLAFFLFTCANLIPRALAHHQWYISNFPETYPHLHRKAILPFIL